MGRIKGLVVVLMLLAITAFLGVSQARAAQLYGYCSEATSNNGWVAFAPQSGSSFDYKVAYEVYSNTGGASSDVAPLAVKLGHALSAATTQSINLILRGAKFNPDKNVKYALIGDNGTDPFSKSSLQLLQAVTETNPLSTSSFDTTIGNTGFAIVAITADVIVTPAANIAFQVSDNQTLLDYAAIKDKYLYLVEVQDNGSGYYIIKDIGSAVHVDPGLNPSCTDNPQIFVNFTAPNDVSGDNVVYANIQPECKTTVGTYKDPRSGITYSLLNLNAELNIDDDLKTFLTGPAVINATEIDTGETSSCGTSSCSQVCNSCKPLPQPCDSEYIVGAELSCSAITGTVSFTLVSSAPENAIESVKFMDQSCSANSDNTAWYCGASGIELDNAIRLQIKVDGKTQINPTAWSITNMSVTPDLADAGINNFCYTADTGDAGAWYGGLEALVPFVKSGDGYETYIKLFNRYDKDAKVFAATFKDGGSGKMIVALTEVATIPANGEIQLTGKDLADKLDLTPDQISYGVPVKFVILVPEGKGCGVWGYGGTCYNNPNDPYVEGIVVSVTPQGQRSIPLEFKYFKNGSYVQ